MSSHSRPTCGIWRKWSITHSEVNPASSAARATAASALLVSPSQPKREICSPNSSASGASAWRAAAAGASRKPGGTSSTGPAAWTPAKPSSPSAANTAAASRSCAATTFGGTGAPRARLRSRTTFSGASSTTAWAGTPAASASSRHAARRLASSPVVSITVVSPRARRFATIRSSSSNASRLARWSRSPRADDRAQAVGGDDLVGLEPRARPVRLPRRRRADQHDEARIRQPHS